MAFHLICNEAGSWRAVFQSFAVGVSGLIAMGWGTVPGRLRA